MDALLVEGAAGVSRKVLGENGRMVVSKCLEGCEGALLVVFKLKGRGRRKVEGGDGNGFKYTEGWLIQGFDGRGVQCLPGGSLGKYMRLKEMTCGRCQACWRLGQGHKERRVHA